MVQGDAALDGSLRGSTALGGVRGHKIAAPGGGARREGVWPCGGARRGGMWPCGVARRGGEWPCRERRAGERGASRGPASPAEGQPLQRTASPSPERHGPYPLTSSAASPTGGTALTLRRGTPLTHSGHQTGHSPHPRLAWSTCHSHQTPHPPRAAASEATVAPPRPTPPTPRATPVASAAAPPPDRHPRPGHPHTAELRSPPGPRPAPTLPSSPPSLPTTTHHPRAERLLTHGSS